MKRKLHWPLQHSRSESRSVMGTPLYMCPFTTLPFGGVRMSDKFIEIWLWLSVMAALRRRLLLFFLRLCRKIIKTTMRTRMAMSAPREPMMMMMMSFWGLSWLGAFSGSVSGSLSETRGHVAVMSTSYLKL